MPRKSARKVSGQKIIVKISFTRPSQQCDYGLCTKSELIRFELCISIVGFKHVFLFLLNR